MSRIAVIDLGTNTFHLLIVEHQDRTYDILHRKRKYVKLASKGSEHISDAAFERGIETMKEFAAILEKQNVSKTRAVATAALRTADNGSEFIQTVYRATGIGIDLIDGFSEANLIAKGVERAVNHHEPDYLIMDIGGGSVEFIHVADHEVQEIWSFSTGVAYLHSIFQHSNPISDEEIEEIDAYLSGELSALLKYLKDHDPLPLIGASGTFEVLANMCHAPEINEHIKRVETEFVHRVYQRMINATVEERFAMPDLPDDRVDLIIVAMILLRFVLLHLPINHIYVSKYALKEGVLINMIEEKDEVS